MKAMKATTDGPVRTRVAYEVWAHGVDAVGVRVMPDRPAAVAEVERILGAEAVRDDPTNRAAVGDFLEGRSSGTFIVDRRVHGDDSPVSSLRPRAYVTRVEVVEP